MTSLYFPIAALFISALLNILYFTKKNVENRETRIYTWLLIVNLIHSIHNCVGIILIKKFNIVNPIINRIDFFLIIFWLSLIFVYIYSITIRSKNYKIFLGLVSLIDLIVLILMMVLPFELINEGEILNTSGLAPSVGFIMCRFCFS